MSEELRLEIDPLALDREWLGQPQQVYNWSKKAADAQLKFDQSKTELAIKRAELDREVRDNPEVYGINKLTETIVDMSITANPEYRTRLKAVDQAKYDLNVVNAAVEALQQRKRALQMLVELWVRQYYADQPTGGTEETYEFEKNAVRSRGRRRMDAVKEGEQDRFSERNDE